MANTEVKIIMCIKLASSELTFLFSRRVLIIKYKTYLNYLKIYQPFSNSNLIQVNYSNTYCDEQI